MIKAQLNKLPKVLAHKASVEHSNFVVPEYILHKEDTHVKLLKRFCPHRAYPISEPGTHTTDIWCKFHNFKWTADGTPLNNPLSLKCGKAAVGRSGLVFKNFVEPEARWVWDLVGETELQYSHSITGESEGSWLWLMDAEADLLHVYPEGIHPFLSRQVKLEDIQMEQGDGWILQVHPNGWWLYIFPFTFVEYGRPGCLMVNHTVPKNDTEFGFTYITQYYYNPTIPVASRMVFETIDAVFKEDIKAAEMQRGEYFPLTRPISKYEDHCVHFGRWVKENLYG